ALGAAYEGIYLLPEHAEGTHPERLDRLFHCIDYVARRCPAGCKKHVPIGALIVHLNDDHRWTREQIAAWLRGERVVAAKPDVDGQGADADEGGGCAAARLVDLGGDGPLNTRTP